MRNLLFIGIVFLLLSSCGISMGDRVDNKNLSVYYLENISQDDAIAFSKYWQENGFVGARKQVIQLYQENETIFVKLIERKKYQDEGITLDEEAMLQDIERALRKNVFQQNVEIVIADNTFRPLIKRD